MCGVAYSWGSLTLGFRPRLCCDASQRDGR